MQPEEDLVRTPWIARLLTRGEAWGVPAIVSSVSLFVPVLLTGFVLERQYHIELLTGSSTMALAWLAVGPWLIHDAVRLSKGLSDNY